MKRALWKEAQEVERMRPSLPQLDSQKLAEYQMDMGGGNDAFPAADDGLQVLVTKPTDEKKAENWA